jgi:hypothetical protein
MRPIARPVLAVAVSLALALAATSAFAQTSPTGTPAHPGFFSSQPQSDPSLFRTLPSEAYRPPFAEQPASQSPAATGATANAANAASVESASANRPLVVVVPENGNGMQEQFDRAQAEAQQAQANRAPAPINGAFTGNTDPNNR